MGSRKSTDKATMRQRLDELVLDMIEGGIRYPDAKREFEKRFLSHIMAKENGNVSQAAAALNIHRNTLRKKLEELKLKPARK